LQDGGQNHSVVNDVLSLASTVLDSGKHTSAEKMIAIAGSARSFGEEVELAPFQAYVGAAADGLEDLANYIDRTQVADILDDITTFAKRQPALAGALAVGAGIVVMQVVRNWRTRPVIDGGGSTRRPRKAKGRGRRRKSKRPR
jgi:hypothetical protein